MKSPICLPVTPIVASMGAKVYPVVLLFYPDMELRDRKDTRVEILAPARLVDYVRDMGEVQGTTLAEQVRRGMEVLMLFDRISGLDTPDARRRLGVREARALRRGYKEDLADLLAEALPEAAARDRRGFPERLWDAK